jgi:hypothetical protein
MPNKKPKVVRMATADGSESQASSVPRGIEVLIKKAAIDAEFRAILLAEREAAAKRIGLTLTPAEVMLLRAIPTAQLEATISHTVVAPRTRNAFLGYTAAVMLAALGATAPLAVGFTGTCGGAAPDIHHTFGDRTTCSITNVSVKPEDSTGNRSLKVITDFLVDNQSRFRAAFLDGIDTQPMVNSGHITLGGVLGKDGKFSYLTTVENTIMSDAARDNIVEAARDLQFPPSDGDIVQVVFTIDVDVMGAAE